MPALVQSVQPAFYSELQMVATCAVNRDIRVTVERFDGLFYDKNDGSFKALGSISDPYNSLTETPAGSGSYVGTFDVTSWADGNYKTDLYDHTASPTAPTKLEDDNIVYVDGGSQSPVGTTLTRVDHNFGSANALAYEASGTPVADADVYAFTLASWNPSTPTIQAVARTKTNANGKWVDSLFLSPGQYVIVFHKPNSYGPDTVNITVI